MEGETAGVDGSIVAWTQAVGANTGQCWIKARKAGSAALSLSLTPAPLTSTEESKNLGTVRPLKSCVSPPSDGM